MFPDFYLKKFNIEKQLLKKNIHSQISAHHTLSNAEIWRKQDKTFSNKTNIFNPKPRLPDN
jgi:hypothetical protein